MECKECKTKLEATGIGHATNDDPIKKGYWCVNPECSLEKQPVDLLEESSN